MDTRTLSERYKPRSLDEIVGHDREIDSLRDLIARPRSCCVCLLGDTGTGKSATADAFVRELGCIQDNGWDTVYYETAPDLNVDTARHYFGNETPFRYVAQCGWHILVIEELEYLHPTVQTFCKDALQRVVSQRKVIVLATSNDLSKLEKPLRHRFKTYEFLSSDEFAAACNARLAEIWQIEAPGLPMPLAWRAFGWDEGTFSMRLALDRMEDSLRAARQEVPV